MRICDRHETPALVTRLQSPVETLCLDNKNSFETVTVREPGKTVSVEGTDKRELTSARRETDNAFRTWEEEKRSGVKESQESGVKESQESGVEESQESGVKESQESGVKESQESGVEESQESGVKENPKSGVKENQESGEKERTAQETLTRSPQASHDPGGSWLSKVRFLFKGTEAIRGENTGKGAGGEEWQQEEGRKQKQPCLGRGQI
ncbi:germ cell nuclear acidic protein-like [Pleurodeles waltl]|uniref:germ cell nuclear acidic protein-like n=1 Tax=Pleurodeles waltl TaxID=8319 RepID=UPI00370976E3